jgi:TolB-like protein
MRILTPLAVGVALFAAGLSLGVFLQARYPLVGTMPEGKGRGGRPTLALLPLRDKSEREGRDPRFILDYLRGGVAARLQDKRVGLLSLAEADRKLGVDGGQASVSPKEAGSVLGVGYVLAGSVTEGGTLVLDVELVDAATGRAAWSDRYSLDATLGAFEKSADKVVGEIAERVTANLSAER